MAAAVIAVAALGVVVQVLVGIAAFALFAFLLRVPTAQEMVALRMITGRVGRRFRLTAAV